jgi:hypothetical protein
VYKQAAQVRVFLLKGLRDLIDETWKGVLRMELAERHGDGLGAMGLLHATN